MSTHRTPLSLPYWFPPLEHLNWPNLITSLSIILGLCGILLAASGDVRGALLCGICAIPCDLLDGLVARKLGQFSPIGGVLDSFADVVSFCLLPAVLGHAIGITGVAGYALSIAYVLAGIWRLAHFHVTGLDAGGDRLVFRGMPTPYAAALVFLLASAGVLWPRALPTGLLAALYLLVALLMLSRLPFPKGGPHYGVMWILLPLCAAGLMFGPVGP